VGFLIFSREKGIQNPRCVCCHAPSIPHLVCITHKNELQKQKRYYIISPRKIFKIFLNSVSSIFWPNKYISFRNGRFGGYLFRDSPISSSKCWFHIAHIYTSCRTCVTFMICKPLFSLKRYKPIFCGRISRTVVSSTILLNFEYPEL
jgi:hypothetical protein